MHKNIPQPPVINTKNKMARGQNTKLSITQSFFELQTPNLAWKFVWTVQPTDKVQKVATRQKTIKMQKCKKMQKMQIYKKMQNTKCKYIKKNAKHKTQKSKKHKKYKKITWGPDIITKKQTRVKTQRPKKNTKRVKMQKRENAQKYLSLIHI